MFYHILFIYLVASEPNITLAELNDERLILPQKDTGASLILWQAFREQGLTPLHYCESSQIDLTMDLVRNNFGIAFFSSRVAEHCGQQIQRIPLVPSIKKPLVMSALRRNEHYPPLKAFWQFAQQWIDLYIT